MRRASVALARPQTLNLCFSETPRTGIKRRLRFVISIFQWNVLVANINLRCGLACDIKNRPQKESVPSRDKILYRADELDELRQHILRKFGASLQVTPWANRSMNRSLIAMSRITSWQRFRTGVVVNGAMVALMAFWLTCVRADTVRGVAQSTLWNTANIHGHTVYYAAR